ncbi:MAG: 2OG-Fe(II) oxygenase [Polyangiales bacterium]
MSAGGSPRPAPPDALRLSRELVDEVRLLPDDERAAVLQGARLRRDALRLAQAQGVVVAEDSVKSAAAGFRRARGLLRGDALDPWLASRGSSPGDFARWIRDEATVQSVRLSSSALAPRDIADFARVAEGVDALWRRALRACEAEVSEGDEDAALARYFDSLGQDVPEDFEGWATERGFDDAAAARRAIARRVDRVAPPVLSEGPRVGDPAPEHALRHAGTGRLRLRDLAGTAVALSLAPSAARGEVLRARWDREGVTAMVVCVEAGDDGERVPWMRDPEGALWGALGLAREGDWHVVLDRGNRVAWIGRDLEGALDAARAASAEPARAGVLAPVLVVPSVFDAAECASLIERWTRGGHAAGAVTTHAAVGETYADAAIKRRRDHLVTDPSLDAWILQRLRRRVDPELLRAFHSTLGAHEAFRVGCYDAREGGMFRPHRDDGNPSVASRRFALSMNLNPDDYEGGRLQLPEYGAELHTPLGAAAVYSASLLHGVTEVTRGRRFALVGFFRGAPRDG